VSDAPPGDDGLDPRPLPDHSVLREGRLVAYLWQREGGVLARPGAGGEPLCEIPWADVLCFDPRAEAVLKTMLAKARSYDAFVFELGMEGFDLEEGQAQPHARVRRF